MVLLQASSYKILPAFAIKQKEKADFCLPAVVLVFTRMWSKKFMSDA
jgi:hypothetical protein